MRSATAAVSVASLPPVPTVNVPAIGSSPEIYEKIDPQTASGAVIFFTVAPGQFTFVTQPVEAKRLKTVTGADAWELTPDGRLKMTVELERNEARVVFVMGADL